jgi:hypothetical protein
MMESAFHHCRCLEGIGRQWMGSALHHWRCLRTWKYNTWVALPIAAWGVTLCNFMQLAASKGNFLGGISNILKIEIF